MLQPKTKSELAATHSAAWSPAHSRLLIWLAASLLGLTTLFLYWPATGHDFVNYDDNEYVLDNAHVTGGLTCQNVSWAFRDCESGNWHPMTWLSHMLDCQLFGVRPWGHHLTSILFHTANTILVFALLRGLTGALWRSLLVAALFGLHPLHVESVAWVSERKDVLSVFFGLLALIFYSGYAQERALAENQLSRLRQGSKNHSRPATVNYLLAIFFFALGLMSKPMLVTWPYVMLLLDYWPLKRFDQARLRQLAMEKTPFIALSIIASVVAFLAQRHEGAMAPIVGLPPGARMENALVSYCRYLGKIFWPDNLSVFYPYPGHWPLVEVLLAGGLLAGISALLFATRRQFPFLLMAWLWFVGTLVPVIGLVQVGKQAMADRYAYFPLLGLLIFVVWGAYELARHRQRALMVLAGIGLASTIVCFLIARHQLGYWQNSETLFRHALAVMENNQVAHNNLGRTLLDNGKMDEAIRQYQETIRLNPNDADAHNDLGIALLKEGRLDEAVNECQDAIRLNPGSPEIHIDLGAALEAGGRLDEAIRSYQEALRLRPDYVLAHGHLAVAFTKEGKWDEAISQNREILQLKPDDAGAHHELGLALFGMGRIDEAIAQYRDAIRLKPGDADFHYALGVACFKKGETAEAVQQYEETIRLNPKDADAHNNLGNALGKQGRADEAIVQYNEAIRLEPDHKDAHYNLGVALFGKGRIDAAIAQFQDAVRLQPDNADAQNNLTYLLKLRQKSDAQQSGPASAAGH